MIFLANWVKADEIDQLVTDLSNSNRLWSWNSGTTFNLRLPNTASTNDVIKRILELSQPKGSSTNYIIVTMRQVKIPNGLRPDMPTYTSTIVSKAGKKKIVLFAYWGGVIGWWNRVYDPKSEAIGHIDLSVKGAKTEGEFIWTTNNSAEIALEFPAPMKHSETKEITNSMEHNQPFVIQMEITEKGNGQMIVSNSVSELRMRYDSVSVPSEMIPINDYFGDFREGRTYILSLQVLQEQKGIGVADVFLK